MKRLFLIVILVVSSAAAVPQPAHASADLIVRSEYTISGQGQLYAYRNVTVLTGAVLRIQAGVTLQVEGSILVQGTLEATGTATLPITFTSASIYRPWAGLIAEEQTVYLEHVIVRWARQPLVLYKNARRLVQVTVEDGLDNTVVFGKPGVTHTSLVRADGLTFKNRLLGELMGSSGIVVEGVGAYVDIRTFVYKDARVRLVEPQFIGIRIRGPYANAQLIGGRHELGCYLDFIQANRLTGLQAGFGVRESCASQVLPVVFIPGYGTSFNLSKQAKAADRLPTLTGWRFIQGVTPAYSDLLKNLRNQGIPYSVAYYDWRLPAADIVEGYIRPVIEETKRRYGVSRVNLVTHSYGGLLARSYVQSDRYAGDVLKLVQYGTPNKGSLKAYPIWAGGEIPEDWQPVESLLRFYNYQQPQGKKLTNQDLIHRYFPSVRELLPTFAGLFRAGFAVPQKEYAYPNTFLLSLTEKQQTLTDRIQTLAVVGRGKSTLQSLAVGAARNSTVFSDGYLEQNPYGFTQEGDGTVLVESAQLPGSVLKLSGTHNYLPALAHSEVVHFLYPELQQVSLITPSTERSSKDLLWFFFDCPVDVVITLSNGIQKDSRQEDSSYFLDEDFLDQGEVLRSDEMIWFALPRMTGVYSIEVVARETTEVRSWVDSGQIVEKSLQAGQSWKWKYQEGATLSSLPPKPTAVPSQSSQKGLGMAANPVNSPSASSSQEAQWLLPRIEFPNVAQLIGGMIRGAVTLHHAKQEVAGVTQKRLVVAGQSSEEGQVHSKARYLALAGVAVLATLLYVYWRRKSV